MTIVPPFTGKRYISRPGVGKRYSVSPRTTYRWEELKILPPPDLRMRDRDYWLEETLDKHDRKQTQKAGKSEPPKRSPVKAVAKRRSHG